MDNPIPARWRRIVERVIADLDPVVLARAAVYLEPTVHPAGAPITAGRESLRASEPSVLAFVDLEPHLNWGHQARFVLLGLQSSARRELPAQFPPERERLRLVHRGAAVEDWMLLTQDPPEEP